MKYPMRQITNPTVITVAMDEIMIGILEEEEESEPGVVVGLVITAAGLSEQKMIITTYSLNN